MSLTLAGYLTDSCTVSRPGKGAYASTPTVVLVGAPCRFVEAGAGQWNQTTKSWEVVGAAQVWLDQHPPISHGDVVTVDGRQFRVINFTRHRDIDGNPDHTKVILA